MSGTMGTRVAAAGRRFPELDLSLSRLLPVVVLPAAALVGYVVGSTASLERLALVALIGVWVAAAIARRFVPYVVAANIVMAVLLPHVFANAAASQTWLLLIGAQCALAYVVGARVDLGRRDLCLVIFGAASLWPYLVGGPIDTLPGALGVPILMYMTGRLAGQRLYAVALTLLVVGTLLGAVAIAQSVPSLESIVPFTAVRNGLAANGSRATGLFNNPNTLGTVEMAIIVVAVTLGARRWTLPLQALCVAGLVLSLSRESLVGLAVGLGLLSLSHVGQPRGGRS